MLLPQIPAATKKTVAAEFGFDIKLLRDKIATSRESLDNRVHRLLALEKHILATERIGSITQPAPWIRGEGFALATRIEEDQHAIFFFLRAGGSYLALGGSAGHLIGFDTHKSTEFGYSYAPRLLDTLRDIDRMRQEFQLSDDGVERFLCSGVGGGDSDCWTSMIYYSCHGRQQRSFKVPISFLARKLINGTYMSSNVTLATPLYIAQAE